MCQRAQTLERDDIKNDYEKWVDIKVILDHD